jgi:DNA-binding CsgD family transcriptional regulator
MALIFPFEKDHLYKLGYKEGKKKARKKIIKRMLLSSLNLSNKQIADCLEVSLKKVKKVAKSIKK